MSDTPAERRENPTTLATTEIFILKSEYEAALKAKDNEIRELKRRLTVDEKNNPTEGEKAKAAQDKGKAKMPDYLSQREIFTGVGQSFNFEEGEILEP
ncbi:hypothetical protein AgCh_017354 [Apium graveolens]